MIQLIQNKLVEIIAACKEHHVDSVSLFGSVAKNSMHEDSDIDLLVEFSDDIDVLEYADKHHLRTMGNQVTVHYANSTSTI